MKLAMISDTHGRHGDLDLPKVDVLVHAGDATSAGTYNQVKDFADWLVSEHGKGKFKQVVFVPGNHDRLFGSSFKRATALFPPYVHVLDQTSVTIDGYKFYGEPRTRKFGQGWTYQVEPHKMGRVWSKVPDDTDVLVAHQPIPGPLGEAYRPLGGNEDCGCPYLALRIVEVKPKLVVCGHIHEGRGYEYLHGTSVCNVSTLDRAYAEVRPPVVWDLGRSVAIEFE